VARDEQAFLDWLIRRHPPARGRRGVATGIGDDCAVVRGLRGRTPGLFKIDSVVDGVHVQSKTTRPYWIGWKALNRPLSDVAAMGGVPRYAVAAACVPRGFGLARMQQVMAGLEAAARRSGVALVGGDTASTSGPFSVSVAVWGEAGPGGPVLRSGARPGDWVWVTGTLGGSILGRHLRFVPRLREARAIVRRLRPTAMMDVSDGLGIDAGRLARAGGVSIALEGGAIPVSREARALARRDGRSALDHALADGEDYELLFTTRPRNLRDVPGLTVAGVRATVIGRVCRGRGVWVVDRGRRHAIGEMGYVHPI
jgi:thiamine-monophosphate kinase